MAKFQSPLLGYNNNVRHKNRVFHIQTEDSGVNHPHIITHLFMDGGRILKSVKKSYAEHVGVDGMSDTVRGLMKEQHKAMFIALRDGQFDYLVDGGPAPAAVVAAAAATAAASAAATAATAATATAAAAPAAGETSLGLGRPAASDLIEIPLVAEAAAPSSGAAAPPTSPDPPRADLELPPNTIDESKRSANASARPPASAVQANARIEELPRAPAVREIAAEDVPTTTRQPAEARPDAVAASANAKASAKTPSGRELTLDFDALEHAATDPASPSLFHSSDLPPPPKNLFAKEPGTGGAYRAVEADPRHEARHDAREEEGGRSFAAEEPGSRGGRAAPPASTRGDKSPQPARVSTRIPASRPSSEARYAPARPAAIFGSTQRPQPQSLFSDELVSDKSLDEVILSYLAEDLEPPRRK
jgi:hypothetical protein